MQRLTLSFIFFFFSSRRRHTRCSRDWSSDVCSSDLNVPGLYAAVKRPTRTELTTWRGLPFSETQFLKQRVQAKALAGLKQYSVLERLWALPTFEIHGVLGGFTGEGAKTVIPAEATAKVSLRLVPNQKLKTVERELAAAVKRLGPRPRQAGGPFLDSRDPAGRPGDH